MKKAAPDSMSSIPMAIRCRYRTPATDETNDEMVGGGRYSDSCGLHANLGRPRPADGSGILENRSGFVGTRRLLPQRRHHESDVKRTAVRVRADGSHQSDKARRSVS